MQASFSTGPQGNEPPDGNHSTHGDVNSSKNQGDGVKLSPKTEIELDLSHLHGVDRNSSKLLHSKVEQQQGTPDNLTNSILSHWAIKSVYFRPTAVELKNDCSLYRSLGIPFFLHHISLHFESKPKSQIDKSQTLLSVGIRNELFSWGVLVTCATWGAHTFAASSYGETVVLFGFCALLGGYPVMVSRYQRARLLNFALRREARRSRSSDEAPDTPEN